MARIVFTALGPTLSEQCNAQGLAATGTSLETADRLAHAVTLCHIQGVLTDSEATRARNRILKAMRLRQVRAAAGASP